MSQPKIICAGEALIDLVSTEYADDFRSADTYRRYPGGSPTNLAMNLALLGCEVGLLASLGEDAAGSLLREALEARGVDVSAVARRSQPTTAILVTRSRAVSAFEAYRAADAIIEPTQIPAGYLSGCRVFHTTAFALSRLPARQTIMSCAAEVVAAGGRLSIDANYAANIWPDRSEALRVIDSYLALGVTGVHGTLVKVSEVDFHRLFGGEVSDPIAAVQAVLDRGAGVVCLTMGEGGAYVSSGGKVDHLPVRKVEVRDTTGAGDAFWSGFLAAHLAGRPWIDCMRAGRSVAERKLTQVGPLEEPMELAALLR